MSDNIYREARKKAAENDSLLNNAENAQEFVRIERTRLLKIETDDAVAYPDEVARMAEAYKAPELVNFYCTQQCPLGQGGPLLIYNHLDRIFVTLMSALHSLEKAEDALYRILEDGEVSTEEKPDFDKLLKTLDKIAYSAESLKLWAQCNGLK